METTQENKLTLTERALYCAQLTQWDVLSLEKKLSIKLNNMETTQENNLTLTERALYCAQLTQWAVLSSDKNLSIFTDYAAHVDLFSIRICNKGWDNQKDYELVEFYTYQLTPARIKIIQKEIAKILGHAVIH